MKKELLIASALTASFGLANVAEAATASYSGHIKSGVTGKDLDSTSTGNSTYSGANLSHFAISISETTDSGIKISTGFTVINESTSAVNNSGLTLTFTDGSALDLISAGNAYGGHLATVPGASGEMGVSDTSSNHAPTDLDWADTSDAVGFDWSSAADFGGIDGLTVGLSGAFGDDGDVSSAATADTSYSVGATLVTTAGDSTVTVGGGFILAGTSNQFATNDMANSAAVSASAVTGDLSLGVGYSTGSGLHDSDGATAGQTDSASIVKVGAKYVSGDITLAVGYLDGEAKDSAAPETDGTNVDATTQTSASISYAVASGVTAILGYTDRENTDEGTAQTEHSGTSWYVGATVSF